MTNEEESALVALGRGRLVYPFLPELRGLRDLSRDEELTRWESGRLRVLEENYAKVKAQDEWFHSAMLSGDLPGAQRAAEKALDIIKEAA